jgi:transposase InsO family protein
VEGKIPMAARRHVTNKLRGAYRRASKTDKGRILTEVVNTTGLARSSARRLLTGPALPDPHTQVDRRALRPRGFSDDARALLERLWALMGCPCGKYLAVMLDDWLPPLLDAGDLDQWLIGDALDEVTRMSPATIDRYLAPIRAKTSIKGISTTRAPDGLKGSISLRIAGDDWGGRPGMIEADTVAHCGPAATGEYARTLTMTDMATGWTENATIRNNARRWIIAAVDELRDRFPFPIVGFDTDNGSEFINHDLVAWLQAQDITQTRSRAYKKNDQATVESKNNHRVRKHGFYWRYDTSEERDLLNQMWLLASIRSNVFTPTKKPIGYRSTAAGRRTRTYDAPRTPWQRVKDSGTLTADQITAFEATLIGINPADLTRRIVAIQNQLTNLAKTKTEDMAHTLLLDMTPLTPSITRLTTTK